MKNISFFYLKIFSFWRWNFLYIFEQACFRIAQFWFKVLNSCQITQTEQHPTVWQAVWANVGRHTSELTLVPRPPLYKQVAALCPLYSESWHLQECQRGCENSIYNCAWSFGCCVSGTTCHPIVVAWLMFCSPRQKDSLPLIVRWSCDGRPNWRLWGRRT